MSKKQRNKPDFAPVLREFLSHRLSAPPAPIEPFGPPPKKTNRYTCDVCGGSIITVDRVAGVTPFSLSCRAQKNCGGVMISAMYHNVEGVPTFEWRKPTQQERKRLSVGMKEHVGRGGLALYPISV